MRGEETSGSGVAHHHLVSITSTVAPVMSVGEDMVPIRNQIEDSDMWAQSQVSVLMVGSTVTGSDKRTKCVCIYIYI